ncbi:peptide chain release factor 3 [Cryptosporangium japonicum]|uniref:Peptide chain release factor 3 n=1 Tax=Cryptosporangium japonicum TaxID=80872 RepID=A0ABP3DCB7_9ACTN
MSDPDVAVQARRRRTFAVISHPDAGKSTLTEALALHADAITQAGAVHGKASRRGVTSDWMEMERERGISVTSAALRFTYRDTILNLVDTPGHADFSEDTYRVLTAVDCAVMLLDAAKGLEPQTLRLFEVCRHRGIPILTFINKWDRPGQDALGLLDAVEERLGIRPTPVTWPVGIAGALEGLVDRRRDDEVVGFERSAGGATVAAESVLDPAALSGDAAYTTAVEELDLLSSIGAEHHPDDFLAGKATPVYFGSAVSNIGVRHLLDGIVDLAPSPGPRPTAGGAPRPLEADFSGVVFKVQANMDRAHRDRIAFVRVCSGRFDRGMQVVHATTGRPFSTKYASSLFGQERSTLDIAYPGDVVGLVNASALRVGDTLYTGRAVAFPPLPAFAPEHFAVLRPKDLSRVKQFRRGVVQLDEEGVVQVLVSDRRGEQAPVLAAVGPMQFDVALHRLAQEFGAPGVLDPLPYQLARRTDAAAVGVLERAPGVEVFTRTRDGALLAVFPSPWRLSSVTRDHPDIRLDDILDSSS